MPDTESQLPVQQQPECPMPAFSRAVMGESMLALLRQDETCADVFSKEIVEKIHARREDYANDGDYKRQVITPVMKAFIAKACPSAKNRPKVAQWIFRQYLSHTHSEQPIMAEDLYKIGKNIAYFDSLKTSPDFKANHDLLSYGTYTAFEKTLEPYLQSKAEKEEKARALHMEQEEKNRIYAETTILYDGPEGLVVIPHTVAASKYWGNNTKWCITDRDKAEMHFPNYNNKSPIIMLLPKGQPANKVALVEHTFYNSEDKKIPALPWSHENLMQRCLDGLSEGARQGVRAWLPENIPAPAAPAEPPDPVLMRAVTRELDRLINFWRMDGNKIPDPELWGNRDFVLTALRHHREADFALGYATEKLREDREVILTAVRRYTYSFGYAADKPRQDPDFTLTVVEVDADALRCAARELKEDDGFITRLLKEVDDFPFRIRRMRDAEVWQPDDADLLAYQANALERIAEKGDMEKFFKYSRHFKSTWGDPDTLFAADPAVTLAKIRAEVAAQYPAAGRRGALPAARMACG